MVWSDELEDQLIEYWQNYPCLYDVSSKCPLVNCTTNKFPSNYCQFNNISYSELSRKLVKVPDISLQ
jgi:hypothetical protein